MASPEESSTKTQAARSESTEAQSPADRSRPVSSPGECLLVVTLLVLPIAVITSAESPTIVSLWGFLTPGASSGGSRLHLYPVWTYFGEGTRGFESLPPSIRIWPIAIAFHLLAAGSASIGSLVGREDRRVTGGLLILAAIASLWVALGVVGRFGLGTIGSTGLVVPIGAVATILTALAVYGTDLWQIVR